MGNFRILGLAMSLIALGSAASASATSVAKASPHNPDLACAAVQELINDLNAGNPMGENGRSFRMFFTDELGFVEGDERDQFVKSMRSANGKADRRKMKLDRLYRLHVKDYSALYLASFSRVSWELKRYEPNGMLFEDEIDDPHWETKSSYWLVGFRTNQVTTLREAGDSYMLSSESNRVKGC